MTVDRKLAFVRSANIGLAQHSVSLLKTQRSNDFWLAILLVDPPLDDIYYPAGHKNNEARRIRLSLRPFLGGYADFLSPPKFSSDWSSVQAAPQGGSMASEVIHYWKRALPQSFDPRNPTLESLAFYPLKIVAAEWVKYVTVMQHCIKMYEYHGEQLPGLEQFNADLRDLQVWRRRSMVSQHKVGNVVRQLKSHDPADAIAGRDIHHLIEDFEIINSNIRNAGRRLENMLPVVTSLVQIIDARQSFAETTNISRLTILALIFVPLSFVASLFSMNQDNGPGGPQFWVYFAVAVPLTLLVFLIAKPPIETGSKTAQWFKDPKRSVRGFSWDLKGKGRVGSEA
ncbi:hypothetical protein N0V90_001619 [Kalmusia sp. IMI 367209]|nr:hypothetical protein N0V90_001619 [Kalmusia sp. IMI 367209]